MIRDYYTPEDEHGPASMEIEADGQDAEALYVLYTAWREKLDKSPFVGNITDLEPRWGGVQESLDV